jgi:hypothetical protein
MPCHGIFKKLLMNKGTQTWFGTIWNYGVKILIIEPFFQWIFKKLTTKNYIGI